MSTQQVCFVIPISELRRSTHYELAFPTATRWMTSLLYKAWHSLPTCLPPCLSGSYDDLTLSIMIPAMSMHHMLSRHCSPLLLNKLHAYSTSASSSFFSPPSKSCPGTRSGMSSSSSSSPFAPSSPPFAFCIDWYDSASFRSDASESGPSWLRMPGTSSVSSFSSPLP
jgi:hypothetical protein